MPRRQRRRPGWLGSRSGLAGPGGAGGRSLAFLSSLLVEYAVEALCAAGVGLALVDREGGALRVGDDSDTPGAGTGGRHERAPVRLPGVERGVVGVADREIREPVRRGAPLLPGHLAYAPVARPAWVIVARPSLAWYCQPSSRTNWCRRPPPRRGRRWPGPPCR